MPINFTKYDYSKSIERIPYAEMIQYDFEKKYGELKTDKSLLYLIRRFGYSEPRDSYKQIADYMFYNDKYKDIIVDVSVSSCKAYVFFYVEENKLKKIYNDNYWNPLEGYYKNFYKYLESKKEKMKDFDNDILPFITSSVETLAKQKDCNKDLLYESFNRIKNWESFIFEIPNFMDGIGSLEYRHEEAYKVFLEWIEPRESQFQEEYNLSKPSFLDAERCVEMEVLKKQCMEILEDFLKPTYIRDVYYNIFGEYKGDLENCETVEYYNYEVA